jgi:Arc/MetJ-type ribon-helix-helix transcriptional regulator
MLERMTTQIAVRLPDEMVAFLDHSVAAGEVPSRAALVVVSIEREMRRRAAARDARILDERGSGDDLDELVSWSVGSLDLDD